MDGEEAVAEVEETIKAAGQEEDWVDLVAGVTIIPTIITNLGIPERMK